MAKILLNTIIGLGDDLSQMQFVKMVQEEKLAIDGIEVRGEMFSENPETRREEFQAYREIADEEDWDLYISYPELFFDINGVRPEIEDFLKESNTFGCKSAKFYAGNVEGILNTNIEAFQEMLSQYNVQLTIENAQTVENGTLENMLLSLDNVRTQNLPFGFTFDLGNWIVMDENPKSAYDATKDFITVFHLKNMNLDKEYTLLENGAANLKDYTQLDVPYILEYPMTWDVLLSELEILRTQL